MTGWLGGPSTLSEDHTEESLLDTALASLHYIFKTPRREIKSQLTAWHVANWVKDSFANGAYAYDTVETKAARKFLNEPLKDTLFFAGEALYNGSAMGTVEAALISGKKVSRQIK